MTAAAVLEVDGLSRHYRLPREGLFEPPAWLYAVNEVSFTVGRGASFGIVGESGCGKSTLARAIMAIEPLASGSVRVLGEDLATLGAVRLRAHRRHFQMVFQDPFGALDPRHRVGRIIAEPIAGLEGPTPPEERSRRVAEALDSVGLGANDAAKFPHQFSGGQRQRIAIARALITRPALLVADEPVSALDVSVQAQVLNLLRDLQERYALAYVLISHDLAVIDYVCDEVAVMYLGRIVERGAKAEILARPAHPYTRALRDAVPSPVPGARAHPRTRLAGGAPSQTSLGLGCAFAPRCPRAEARCHAEAPSLREIAPGHLASCHFA